MNYIGRFAPSPSGPLHFGSLVAALGSYFQAKSNHGLWLVRIEDLDPPREVPGAANQILKALEAYHLFWDGEVIYQSQRHELYQAKIDEWLASGQAYFCQCTRREIRESGGYYLGTCQEKHITQSKGCAIRLKIDEPVCFFHDRKHGRLAIPPALANEDFVIKRSDGLFAYNLAVVLDDIDKNITEVVRGADLIEPTGRQISLYKLLNKPPVSYLHLPLAVDATGQKLSKQNHATAIDVHQPKATLIQAMAFLGLQPPVEVEQGELDEILAWGVKNWSIDGLSAAFEITTPFSNGAL